MDIRYLGHSAVELSDGETRLLIDPFLTGNPNAAASPDELEPDVILLTHGHADHLGDTVPIARRTGAPSAQASAAEITRAGRLLGEGLGSMANLLDLELVAVGGSVALGFGEPFFAAANDALHATSRMPFTRDCRVVPVGLGEHGPLVGAGALAWRLLGRDAGPA